MLGLFTTKAYVEPASQTPLLHRKLGSILAAEDLIEGSHDYKAAISLFDSFPKDELLAAPVADLRRAVVALLGGVAADRVRVLGRRHPDGRSASIIVDLPKARYDAEVLARLREVVRARVGSRTVDAHEVLGEGDRVQIHLTAHRPDGGLGELSLPALQREISDATRTWDDRASEALVARNGERGRVLAARWAKRLPASYKAAVDPSAAAEDIACFERLFISGSPFHVGLRNEGELTRIGLYRIGGKLELSRAMPMLEHLGLRVIEERPTRLVDGTGETWLQDFGVLGPTDRPLDLDEAGERIADCIAAVWRGEAESDSLNRLVITTSLDWRQVAVLRAYRKYRQRAGLALHRELPARRDRGEPAHHREAGAAVRAALRPGARARRAGGGRAARGDPRGPRRGRLARPRPDPAQPARPDRGDGPDERLPRRAARARVQDPLGRRAGDAAAGAAVRDLHLLARGRGHPPARRQDRPRRPALVGPHGLPHRGLRPHARADDEERGDRPGRREGRLPPHPPPGGPGASCAPRSSASTSRTSRACST